MTQQDWTRAFFEGPFGAMQLAGHHADRTGEDVDFIVHTLGLQPGSSILDVPCGAGQIGLELSRRGFGVTGVDFNDKVVKHARQVAETEGLAARFLIGDMRELDVPALGGPQSQHAVICYFSSVGYGTDEEDLRFFRASRELLAPGGQLLVETQCLESLLPNFTKTSWQYLGEASDRRYLLQERRYEALTGRIESTWIFMDDGREQRHEVSLRMYSVRELASALRATGFSAFRALATRTQHPFTVGSGRLSLIATA